MGLAASSAPFRDASIWNFSGAQNCLLPKTKFSDNNKSKGFMENEATKAQTLVRESYEKLKEARPEDALAALENALRIDIKHDEALYALQCLNWWLEKIKNLEALDDSYSKGAFLLSLWKSFYNFLERIGGVRYDSCQYALRHFIYCLALQNYRDVLEDGSLRHDPDLLLQIGRCYKGVGDYEKALEYLIKAAQYKKEDGLALSELADVFAMTGDIRKAKALFREAFYVDPLSVDLQSIESDMMRRLAGAVAKMGFSGDELLERIGVYGALMEVFSVKRELKLSELGRLKQSIFSLENEVRTKTEGKELLIPRLLNKYIWLMDHYEANAEPASFIDELKLKIKIIEPSVYEQFLR
jgi:tetratricopeptide (TPR) repeat protein